MHWELCKQTPLTFNLFHLQGGGGAGSPHRGHDDSGGFSPIHHAGDETAGTPRPGSVHHHQRGGAGEDLAGSGGELHLLPAGGR